MLTSPFSLAPALMPELTLSDFSTSAMIYIAACAFLSATFHSVSGYAGGLILAICLAPVIGVKAVVPVLAMSLLISHSSRVWAFKSGIQWPTYRDVMMTALPGIIFGASIYSLLPIGGIAIVLGFFLLASAPLRRLMQKMKIKVGRKALMGAGVPFGLLSGAAIGAGLILAPFFLAAGLAGEALLGTMAAVAFTVNVVKTAIFSGFSVLSSDLAILGVAIGACAVPGNLLGRWIIRNTPIRLHIALVETVVAVGGFYFLWIAAQEFGWA